MRNFFLAVLIFFFSTSSAFAALSCTVSAVCNSPDVVVFRMYATSNSHAELPNQSNYANLVCCSGVTGLANTCTNTYSVVARLSSDTNAHIEESGQTTVAYDGRNACLSVPSGGTTSVSYQNNNCSGFDTTLASMSSTTTNSHVGDAATYTRKICASATGATSNNQNSGGGVVAIGLNRPPILQIVDFNKDGKVNILDLSILLYFFENQSPLPNIYDLNKDGKIGFPDVSVLFFYWEI